MTKAITSSLKAELVEALVKKEAGNDALYANLSVDDGLEQSLMIVLRSLAWVDKHILAQNPNKDNMLMLKTITDMLHDLKKEERQALKELDPDKL